VVYRLRGAFFFGATSTVISTLERMGQLPKTFVFDFSAVPIADTTAAKGLEAFARKLARAGTTLIIAGANPAVRRALVQAGLREPGAHYVARVEDAADLRAELLRTATPAGAA
jgi:sulfate permease, SulP family